MQRGLFFYDLCVRSSESVTAQEGDTGNMMDKRHPGGLIRRVTTPVMVKGSLVSCMGGFNRESVTHILHNKLKCRTNKMCIMEQLVICCAPSRCL